MNTTFETVVIESLLLVACAVSIGFVAFILYIMEISNILSEFSESALVYIITSFSLGILALIMYIILCLRYYFLTKKTKKNGKLENRIQK